MSDSESIKRLEGNPQSVDIEPDPHQDWVQQEAQLLMDELFSELHPSPKRLPQSDSDAVDVDWVEGIVVRSSSELNQWGENYRDDDPWISQPESAPFWRRLLFVVGGIAIVAPLSFWGGSVLRSASHSRRAAAAVSEQPPASEVDASDKEFSIYADQALRQIKAEPKQVSSGLKGISVPQSDRPSVLSNSVPAVVPTIAANPTKAAKETPVPSPKQAAPAAPQPRQAASKQPSQPAPSQPSQAKKAPKPQASQADIDRLALRVFKPKDVVQSQVPPVSAGSGSNTPVAASENVVPAPQRTITAAPANELPNLSANIAAPEDTIASATPMNSPDNASKKVIGIVELGLQSTLMVSNNGSHLNFKVGDTVNDDGWKLVQIAQGKAILQKGEERRTLSEGQYF